MQQPLWKKYLSYLYEFTVERTSSPHNEILDILYSKGRYQLVTRNAIYSFQDLYVNFFKAFEKVNIRSYQEAKVLVLGLGLGSIPYMLEKRFNCKFDYTAVELDEEIVRLAHQYVLKELDSNIEVICTDASNYLRISSDKFDVITMDIFIDDYIPIEFETIAYLNTLKSKLNEGGMLIYNRLYLKPHDIKDTIEFFTSKFLEVFPKGKSHEIDGNLMLVGRV